MTPREATPKAPKTTPKVESERTVNHVVSSDQLPEPEGMERVRNDVYTDPAPIKARSGACNVPTCTKDEVWFGLCEGHRRSRPGDRTRKARHDG